ncbi:hypothetical protein MMPV_006765 [Pyropia vietnamensis]
MARFDGTSPRRRRWWAYPLGAAILLATALVPVVLLRSVVLTAVLPETWGGGGRAPVANPSAAASRGVDRLAVYGGGGGGGNDGGGPDGDSGGVDSVEVAVAVAAVSVNAAAAAAEMRAVAAADAAAVAAADAAATPSSSSSSSGSAVAASAAAASAADATASAVDVAATDAAATPPSTCIVVKQAGPSLREHIIRNSLAGVDAFFVYDDNGPSPSTNASSTTGNGGNGSSSSGGGVDSDTGWEDLHALLAPFGAAVTVVPATPRRKSSAAVTDHPQVQRRSFYDCVRRHGSSTRWMTLLDSDEFFETAASPPSWAPNPTAFAHTPFLWASLRPLEAATPLVPVRWSTVLTSGRLVPPSPHSPHTLASYHPTSCTVMAGVNLRELADWKSIFQPAALDMSPGSLNHDAFFVHGVTDARSPTDRSVVARTDVRAVFKAPWAGLARLNESAMSHPNGNGPAHQVVHYWSRDLLSYLRKMARGRPNDGRGKGGPRSIRTLIRREAACAAVGPSVPAWSASARHETVAAYLADLPPPPSSSLASEGVAEAAVDARVPIAAARTDGPKGAELARRLLAGETLDAGAMCKAGVAAMCISPEERGRWPWAWARWMSDASLTAEDAMWTRI